MIGDPSGQKGPSPLTRDRSWRRRTYRSSFFQILDREKTEIRFNSGGSMRGARGVRSRRLPLARMLERDDSRNGSTPSTDAFTSFSIRFRRHTTP